MKNPTNNPPKTKTENTPWKKTNTKKNPKKQNKDKQNPQKPQQTEESITGSWFEDPKGDSLHTDIPLK